MSTKILDRDKVLELIKTYRPQLVYNKAGGGIASVNFNCPFHNDTNPSFTLQIGASKGSCHACKTKASLQELIAAFEQISQEQAKKIVDKCLRQVTRPEAALNKAKAIDVSMTQIQEWHNALGTELKLQALIKRWGWTPELCLNYLIGVSEGRLTIPMMEQDVLVGLKYYAPGTKGVKYMNHPGSAPCCWPLGNLVHDTVILVEGEKDCLTMLAAGFNAVTFTTGAGSCPGNYIRYFAGKEVYIIYDIDEAGRKGAVTVANILNFAARKIHIVELPLEGIPKGDLTDAYMQDPENFVDYVNELMKNTDVYQAPAAINRVTVPTEVFPTYLEDLDANKLFYKRVNMKVRVISNTYNETTIVPKDVELTCNRDYRDHICQACPAFYKPDGMHFHVKPEYPELLNMIGNNIKVQRAAIAGMTGVPTACTQFKINQKSHQAVYPIVIIPAIEANKKKHSYAMIEAWALDIPAKENEDYDAEGVVLANPDTQRRELVCYRLTKDVASLDDFELSPEKAERLKVFQCRNQLLKALQTS